MASVAHAENALGSDLIPQAKKRKLAKRIKEVISEDRNMELSIRNKFRLGIIFLLFLVDLDCFSFGFRSKIPMAPLGDKTHFVLASIPQSRLSEFKNSTNQKFASVYEENQRTYFVLPRSVWNTMDNSQGFLKEEPSNLGFKFYAENYQAQIKKINFELGDLVSGYKDNVLNEKYLHAVASSYPDLATRFQIGTTKAKNRITALRLSDPSQGEKDKISLLFTCAIHANEVITTDHCYDIIYTILKDPKEKSNYLKNINVWVIPIANPDGSEAFWQVSHLLGRKNSTANSPLGVDLNRNFPFHWGKTGGEYSSNKSDSPYYQGPVEASEPETQALMRLSEENRFAAAISYHAFANSLLFPYSVEGFLNPNPDLAEIMGKKISKNVKSTHPQKNFYLKKNLYPIDGVDQDYYYYKHGTLAYILESSHFNPDYKYVPKILDSFRSVWIRLIEEIVSGEKLILKIQNEKGSPILARVTVKAQTYFEGEARTNNPISGIFYMYYHPALKGEIQIEAEGYLPTTIQTKPKRDWTPEIITLKKIL
jgi:hypothetical protein